MGRTMTVSAVRCPISIEADRLREEARVRKEDNLAKITKVCVDAREEADSWYNTKILETNTDYQGKQTEYNDAVNALNLEHQRCIDETTTVFNTQKNNLIANQQEDETSAEKCSIKVTELIQRDKDCYNVNKQELDDLWHQVAGTMLHERSIIAYEQLKSPVTDLSKFKHYSLLVAYLQQLTTSDVISKAEFDKFKGFFYTLCNSNNVERDHNFKEADSKFLALLKSREYQDSQMAYSACQEDYVKHVTTYKDAIDLNVVLYNKVVEVKKEINVKYQQALIELTAKHQQKQEELQSHYTEMLTTTANSWGDYQNKHQGCLADLENSKNSQLTEINNYENTEKEKVNDQYNAELKAIEEAVKRKLQEIQELSDAHAAQRKRLRKSKFINACISITAGVAAVFSGGLLSGVSEIVAQAVQTSLIATSLRALERLVNRKDKFGLDIQFSLSGPTPEKFTPSNRANRNTAAPTMEAPQFNLTTVRERFAAIQQNVKSWQATIEHDLFYSLHREILPVGNFSNALVNYGRQNTNNTRFSCNANLGALQANGYRSVAWNILSNNQTKWSGMDFMRDSDLCNIMRRFNVSNNAISSISNWHRPQVLSFKNNYVSSSKPMLEGQSQSTNQFTSEGQASSSWSDNDFDLGSMLYSSQSKMLLNSYQQHKVGTRAMGAMQAAYGASQIGLSVALAGTGVGVIPATILATRGGDNILAGARTIFSGNDTPTMFNQVLQGAGLGETTTAVLEFGLDIGSMVPTMARNAVGIYKTGMLKLYDMRMARQPVISASTPAEIAWGAGELSSRQTAMLDVLPKTGSELKLHKSGINPTDIAALTAYTGKEFAIFTRGSQRLVIRGNSINMGLEIEDLKLLQEQGFKFSAHTHPTNTTFERYILNASGGDRLALKIFKQERSLILDSLGRRNIFDQTDNLSADILQSLRQANNNLPRPQL